MIKHPIEQMIEQADQAINRRDFATLVEMYTDDAILVIKPGMNAVGKTQIHQAFEAISAHFEHTLRVHQAGMQILETSDSALALARTVISATNLPETERKATYVFVKSTDGRWLCSIDNSYGHDLLEMT